MDFPILLSVRYRDNSHPVQIITDFLLFSNILENVIIHIKVFPKVEVRDGKEYAIIEKVKAKFTTTK